MANRGGCRIFEAMHAPRPYPLDAPFGRANFTPVTVLFVSLGLMFTLQQLLLPALGFWFIDAVWDISLRDVISGEAAMTTEAARLLKVYFGITHVIVFGGIAWVMAKSSGNTLDELGLYELIRLRFYVLGIAIAAAAIPALQMTAWDANSFTLPEALKELEEAMRELEGRSEALTQGLLAEDLVLNLLVLALLPALFEELFFRGLLQNTCRRMMNIHLAIWLTAFIFSAIHFQIYGFVYRMLLGALFGYLYFWSGSIWPAIGGHLANNAIGVIVTHGRNQWDWPAEVIDDPNFEMPWYLVVGSLLVTAALALWFRHMTRGRHQEHEERLALHAKTVRNQLYATAVQEPGSYPNTAPEDLPPPRSDEHPDDSPQ